MARWRGGDEDAGSDLDLLIAADMPFAGDLATRLQPVAGRRVDLAHLTRVEAAAPLLLDRILDEGRVLVDRDGLWSALRERRRAIRARAMRAHRRQMVSANRAIAELTR
jgi:hypothetical protein